MIINNKIKGLALFAGAAAASAGAYAGPSNQAEYRGYSKCLDTAHQASHGLSTDRVYLLSKAAAHNQYYINATRWQDGERVAVRIACQTSSNGRVLVSQEIAEGQFNNRRGEVSVEVAER